MKQILFGLLLSLLAGSGAFAAVPDLPITGTRIVNVASEPQLRTAMNNLRHGDTILLADGTYNLSGSLHVNGRNAITIRGRSGSTNVVLVGKGMDNPNHGGVPFGIWSNGTNTTIAHLTIRETYDNPIIFNPGAQAPHIYSVRLINAGSQFIKSNPTDVAAGLGVNDGRVEYCWFEYTGNPPNDHGAGVGYFNGISAHAAKNWVVRGNVFKNLHNPDGSAYPWNPAVLFWRNSSNTITEQNIFINVDRAIAYGLDNSVPYRDHSGGIIRNNFVYLAPGFLSAARKKGSDGAIIAWNSPGTRIDHNTLLLNGNEFYAIEFRFPTSSNGAARNNLTDALIHLRDNATAELKGNILNAAPGMFVNPALGDLHLLPAAAAAFETSAPVNTVTNDFDNEIRQPGARKIEPGADELTELSRPIITHFELAAAGALLRFTADNEIAYAVERSESLNGTWTVASNFFPGTGSLLEYRESELPSNYSQFYRIKAMP